jgi:hypothetical protein
MHWKSASHWLLTRVFKIFKHTVLRAMRELLHWLCVYFVIYLFGELFICKYDVYSDSFVNHDSPCAMLKDMQALYSMYKAVAVTIIYICCMIRYKVLRRYVRTVTEHGRAWAFLCCCCRCCCCFPIGCAGGRLLVL